MPRTKSTHVDEASAVGRRVREARTDAGLSQRELAFAGCSAAYISLVESGARIPSLQVLRELGRRLGVSADYLARGGTDPTPPLLYEAELALRLDDTEEAERLYNAVLDGAPSSGMRADALEGLGHVAFRRGEWKRAIDGFREAARTAAMPEEDRPALADGLARSYAAAGLLAESISLLERCTVRYKDEPLQFIRFAGLLGSALTDNGSFAEAERLLADALTRGRETSDPYARARLYWTEARLRLQQGQPEEAEEFALRALELLRATEDGYALGRLLQGLAQIYTDSGRAGEALDLLREVRPLILSAGTPLEAVQLQLEEARALAEVGETEAAAAAAMDVASKLVGDRSLDAGRTYLLLGQIFATLGETARSREVLELAVEILEESNATRYLVDAYKSLGGLLKEDGEFEAALTLFERALNIQKETGRRL